MHKGKFSHYSGRVVQVIEALSINDACSNHVFELKNQFDEIFGKNTEIYAHYYHSSLGAYCCPLSSLQLSERDIVIDHYSGYSEFSLPYILSQKATRVMVYHNITPHEYFETDSPMYDLCKRGRAQLKSHIGEFDYFVGVSEYNLEELVSLGADKGKTSVVPIVLKTELEKNINNSIEKKDVLYVGRIVENKRQDKIVEYFSSAILQGYEVGNLVLVGKYDKNGAFYKKLLALIDSLGLNGRVIITGEVDGDELDKCYRSAKVFLSYSGHEGFGVPLLEACRYGLPVLAYDAGAVKETLRRSPGIFHDDEELNHLIDRLNSDPEFEKELVKFQYDVLQTYDAASIGGAIECFVSELVPSRNELSTVSIVICTYNRADYLDRVLHYLTRQYDSRFEVVVVNGPSTDHTDTVINKWREKIRCYQNPSRNLSISRNIGIKESCGDIVAFIDDDAIPFADWVGQILSEYNSVPIKVAGIGGVTFYAGSLEYQADDIVIDSYGTGKINPSFDDLSNSNNYRTLLGTNSSFKREVLVGIGGFDEEYDYFLDESDVCLRLLENSKYLLHSREINLRHEFAQSDNRLNKYNFNWYSICKNTAYFSCRFNGGYSEKVESEIRNRIEMDRINHLKQGLRDGDISMDEFVEMKDDIWQAVIDGMERSKQPRKLSDALAVNDNVFKGYVAKSIDFKCLHIVLVTKEFPPFTKGGGVGALYYHLASELLILGHRVSVVVQGSEYHVHDRGRFKLYFVPHQVKEEFKTKSDIANRNLNWSLSVAQLVINIDSVQPISIIDGCVWDAETYALSLYKEKLKVPLVVRLVTPFYVACSINNWQIKQDEVDLLMGIERALVANADAVVAISDSITETFSRHYGMVMDERWRRIYAGITPWATFDIGEGYAELQNMPAIADAKKAAKKVFLFVGRLELRKGVDVLLQAIDIFVSEFGKRGDFIFVLAGSDCMGVEENLDGCLSSWSRKYVHLTGDVSDSDREKLYNIADVVVFPSKYESFGLVPLEAFVHSTPVVGSNKGAIPEVVQDGVSGLIFNGDDAKDLAECIKRLYLDDEFLARLSHGAKARVRELSAEKMACESVALYHDLAGAA